MELTKVTDRLRTGLSTAEKTGPVLPADRPFLHRVGNERGYERKILNTIRTIRTYVISVENSANTFSTTESNFDVGPQIG
eukprot:6185481-Pleurochrysis_carterae.AAC.1